MYDTVRYCAKHWAATHRTDPTQQTFFNGKKAFRMLNATPSESLSGALPHCSLERTRLSEGDAVAVPGTQAGLSVGHSCMQAGRPACNKLPEPSWLAVP